MSNLTCPKCGGSDSFISQRNIVKGRGIYQSGKIRGVAVCRVCDEIMTGATYEKTKLVISRNDWVLFSLFIILNLLSYFGQAIVFSMVAYFVFIVLIIQIVRRSRKHKL
jgi:hypothetical protein